MKYGTRITLYGHKNSLMTPAEVTALVSYLESADIIVDTLSADMTAFNPTKTEDMPDTSNFTEVGYPKPEYARVPAEESAPDEEPKEEPKEEKPVPSDVTKDDLKAALREFRDRFGSDALRELYNRFGDGATKLVDLPETLYSAMYAGAQEKLGVQ